MRLMLWGFVYYYYYLFVLGLVLVLFFVSDNTSK